MKFNRPARELPSSDSSFLCRTYKFKKYRRVILGPSSHGSIAIFEKKLEKKFTEFFLSHPKEWIFDQNKINIREN